jgi:signal transduction histidine kinase
VNVNQLLDDLALLTRHKLHQQNVELVRDLGPDLPRLLADATQLEQAFLNLTLNAVEAMPGGGRLTIASRALRVRRTRPGPTHVAVSFRDTGTGMSAEQRRRAFTSLLSTTKPKGTGFGMAIVAKVVEAHRGKVRIRSRPGAGTTILLILPV